MKKIIACITFIATASIATPQTPGNAIHLDGMDDIITAPLPAIFNSIANNNFTIEMWIRPDSLVGLNTLFHAQMDQTHYVHLYQANPNLLFATVEGNSVYDVAVSTTSIPALQWTHIAMTWDRVAQEVELYINGIPSSPLGGGNSVISSDTSMLFIGSHSDSSKVFFGHMDEFRIWDVVRTDCEIKAGMYSEYTVLPPHLVTYYNFNQGVADGSNPGETTLPELTGNYDATLHGFALAGNASNWMSSGAEIYIDTNHIAATSVAGGTLSAHLPGAIYQWLDCDNNYMPVAGAYNQSFTPGVDGNYAVEVTMNGCTDTSACYAIIGVGITENTHESPITLYPNPSNGLFTVSQLAVAPTLVKIHNAMGQTVATYEFKQKDKIQLDLSDQPAGQYMVSIQTNQLNITKKIVLLQH